MGPENDNNKDCKFTIYMEIEGMAVDDEGNAGPAGCKLELGGLSPKKPYAEMVKDADPKEILRAFGMNSIADNHECRIITPEEYEREYGDHDDED